MTDHAIFQATFSDLRIVKGRKVGQFVLEVPLEGVDQALKALGGVPRPDKEVWVVVARLDPKAVQKPPEEPEKAKPKLSQECAILCHDPRFEKFIAEQYPAYEDVVLAVRELCGVKSRSEFDTDPAAAGRWHDLHTEFKVWERT